MSTARGDEKHTSQDAPKMDKETKARLINKSGMGVINVELDLKNPRENKLSFDENTLDFYYKCFHAVRYFQGGHQLQDVRRVIVDKIFNHLSYYLGNNPDNNDLKKILGDCVFAQKREALIAKQKNYF